MYKRQALKSDGVIFSTEAEEALGRLKEYGREICQAKESIDCVHQESADRVTDLGAQVEVAASKVMSRFPNLTVSVDVQSDEHVAGTVDDLQAIMQCLLENAAKHGGWSWSRKIKAKVTVRNYNAPTRKSHSRSMVRIDVANTGHVPTTMVPCLFADGVTSSSEGAGAGLSSARRIAAAHRGDVALTKRLPATFTCCLLYTSPSPRD